MQKTPCELYTFLENYDLLKDSPPLWWPDAGSFSVVITAVLTQNTTWSNVEKSVANLKGFLELESFVGLDEECLKEKIKPSGFYNQKAPRLLQLAKNIQKEFQSFEQMQKEVSRSWLLAQKGIGPESADAILCYGCLRPEMVVDTYTKRFLASYGIVFQGYDGYKKYLENGLRECFGVEELVSVFARFHGMIVEYNKRSNSLKPLKQK